MNFDDCPHEKVFLVHPKQLKDLQDSLSKEKIMNEEKFTEEELELIAKFGAEEETQEHEFHEDPVIEKEEIPTAIISEKIAEEIEKIEKKNSPIEAFRKMTEVGNQTGKRIG